MALRLIQFLIPEASSEQLEEALRELETIRFWQVATHDESALLCVLVEADQAETIIQKVEGMSFGDKDFRAILLEVKGTAPLLIPNMALSLATTLGNGKLARHALKANVVGVLLALALAAAVGFILPMGDVDLQGCKEITSRAEIGYSDIVLALAAGGAGALAFTSGVSAALVGVMVAVAILPPLAAAGLLIGAGYWVMGIKALLLTLANIICVNLSGVGMFLLQGVRPRFFWEAKRARRMLRWGIFLWVVLLVFLMGVIFLNQRFPIQ